MSCLLLVQVKHFDLREFSAPFILISYNSYSGHSCSPVQKNIKVPIYSFFVFCIAGINEQLCGVVWLRVLVDRGAVQAQRPPGPHGQHS